MKERFKEWQYPKIEEGKLTKYNWMVQNKDGLKLGYKTDIGAFTYINDKNGVVIEDINKPKAKMDKNEFDVIDLFINKHGKAECCIYACSISSDYEKNNKEQL